MLQIGEEGQWFMASGADGGGLIADPTADVRIIFQQRGHEIHAWAKITLPGWGPIVVHATTDLREIEEDLRNHPKIQRALAISEGTQVEAGGLFSGLKKAFKGVKALAKKVGITKVVNTVHGLANKVIKNPLIKGALAATPYGQVALGIVNGANLAKAALSGNFKAKNAIGFLTKQVTNNLPWAGPAKAALKMVKMGAKQIGISPKIANTILNPASLITKHLPGPLRTLANPMGFALNQINPGQRAPRRALPAPRGYQPQQPQPSSRSAWGSRLAQRVRERQQYQPQQQFQPQQRPQWGSRFRFPQQFQQQPQYGQPYGYARPKYSKVYDRGRGGWVSGDDTGFMAWGDDPELVELVAMGEALAAPSEDGQHDDRDVTDEVEALLTMASAGDFGGLRWLLDRLSLRSMEAHPEEFGKRDALVSGRNVLAERFA